ncbi:MAG: hypothetical protein KDK05_12735 [Candidatus Competibacteraceae bacterium]|nr:hypothetical protein [Candidatus Competibacteraceae bacterium]
MKPPIVETCEMYHNYYKESGSDTRCPICLAIGLKTERRKNMELVRVVLAHLEKASAAIEAIAPFEVMKLEHEEA